MSGTLHLAQALSNRRRRGRKKDFRDAERLVKRLVSQELTLSFVPDGEHRLWRTLTRTRYQRTRDKVRLQNQLEALLEEAHIKLSSLVSHQRLNLVIDFKSHWRAACLAQRLVYPTVQTHRFQFVGTQAFGAGDYQISQMPASQQTGSDEFERWDTPNAVPDM